MDAYGLYELHFKAKDREQTNNKPVFRSKNWTQPQTVIKKRYFPPPHDEILTANSSEKEPFSVNWQIKKGQTARL